MRRPRGTLAAVYVPPEWKKRFWIAAVVVPLLLPGWRGELVPVPHAEIILDASRYDAADVIPATRVGDAPGEQWHLQFMGSPWASMFDTLNLREFAARVAPPQYVAHIPPGLDDLPERADAYFRVKTAVRWPWWWPGGGVDYRMPDR